MHVSGKVGFALVLPGLLAISAIHSASAQTPISYFPVGGNATDVISGNNGTLQGGVANGPGLVGQGFVFNGTNGVVKVPDAANLAITGSLSITADVDVAQLPANGNFGLLVFRGDNRGGFDPYFLDVTSTGDGVYPGSYSSPTVCFRGCFSQRCDRPDAPQHQQSGGRSNDD